MEFVNCGKVSNLDQTIFLQVYLFLTHPLSCGVAAVPTGCRKIDQELVKSELKALNCTLHFLTPVPSVLVAFVAVLVLTESPQ
jgi:hypothetical protein